MIPKSQLAAVKKYQATHYDKFTLRMPIGDLKGWHITARAAGYKSLNEYIVAAMEEKKNRAN